MSPQPTFPLYPTVSFSLSLSLCMHSHILSCNASSSTCTASSSSSSSATLPDSEWHWWGHRVSAAFFVWRLAFCYFMSTDINDLLINITLDRARPDWEEREAQAQAASSSVFSNWWSILLMQSDVYDFPSGSSQMQRQQLCQLSPSLSLSISLSIPSVSLALPFLAVALKYF